MSTRALQFQFVLNGVRDPQTDAPLSNGTVEFYSAGTNNPLNVWDEKEKTNARTSVALDSNGQAVVYGDGIYKLVLKDSAGVEVSYSPIDNFKVRAVNTGVVEVNANYTATPDDDLILADTTSGAITITLYPAADFIDTLTINNTGASGNSVTVDGDGTEQIDGAATATQADSVVRSYDSNGSNWFGSGVGSGAGGLLVDEQIFTVNGTWTKPDTANFIEVLIVAGGGGGGGVPDSLVRIGGAGGGGAGIRARLSSIPTSATVVVGAAGSGGAATGGTGGVGGSSTFTSDDNGSDVITVSGGAGGGGFQTDPQVAAGGTATTVPANTWVVESSLLINGSPSSTTFTWADVSGAANFAYGGKGGDGVFGLGFGASKTPTSSSSTGSSASGYGAGGSGAWNLVSAPGKAGGNGTQGVVIVRSYS